MKPAYHPSPQSSPHEGRGSRGKRLAQLFVEAAKRGIGEELRNEIAPRELGHRLSEASEAEIAALARYIMGEAPPPSSLLTPDSSRKYKERYEELGIRDGMATPKQLRQIEAMWMDVSRMPDRAAKERALKRFLKRIVGVDDMRFVEAWMVRKVVAAIRGMKSSRR